MAAEPRVIERAKEEAEEYRHGEDRPLGGYLALIGTYTAGVTGMSLVVRRSGRPLPERLSWSDLALMAVATHKIARTATKDSVTSALRAPFTRYKGTAGPAELAEDVRGEGPRKAIGELVTCPFCFGHWVATGLAFGFVLAPRATRLGAGIFTALAGADFLHFAYARMES